MFKKKDLGENRRRKRNKNGMIIISSQKTGEDGKRNKDWKIEALHSPSMKVEQQIPLTTAARPSFNNFYATN